MDHPLLVGVLHGLADGDKQFEALPGAQLILIAVLGDRDTPHQFHYEAHLNTPEGLMPKPVGQFRFRRLDNIGTADAEEDAKFLRECFVDTGDLKVLRDPQDARRILLGRTGSGKTALVLRLKEIEDRVISIDPESLALSPIPPSCAS